MNVSPLLGKQNKTPKEQALVDQFCEAVFRVNGWKSEGYQKLKAEQAEQSNKTKE